MGIELGFRQSELITAKVRSREQPVITRQQWPHLAGDLVSWVLASGSLILIWGVTGAGIFWPILPIVGLGLGAALFATFAEPSEERTEWEIEQGLPSPTMIRMGPHEDWRASA